MQGIDHIAIIWIAITLQALGLISSALGALFGYLRWRDAIKEKR